MEILEIKDKKDGSAIMTYILNDEEEKVFRDLAKERKVRFNKKFCNISILEALKIYLDKNDK